MTFAGQKKPIWIFIAALIFAVAISMLGHYALDWDWAVTALSILAFSAIASLVCLIVLYFIRKGHKQDVLNGIQTKTFTADDLAPDQPSRSEQIKTKWQSGLKTLTEAQALGSHPWYVLLGGSGCGKSSAVRNCGVPMPPTGLKSLTDLTPTANLDWWFLDTAVIVDTAGAYCFPTESPATAQEWQTFLQLLTSTRTNEPFNGVIVSISVEDLLTRNAEQLTEDAKRLRRRINSLTTASSRDVPIYLMLTKADLISGFTPFFQMVPEKGREQILGALNNNATDRGEAFKFFDESFTAMIERLQRLRLSILMDVADENTARLVFLFPEELKNLRTQLGVVVQSLFAENTYEATPFFRGFMLVSARQTGKPFSIYLSQLGLEPEAQPEEKTTSFFLKDFFGQVLKNDRALTSVAKAAREWRSQAIIVGLVGWIAACLAVLVLLTLFFERNMSIMKLVTPDLKTLTKESQPVDQSLDLLNSLYQSVDEIYQKNRESSLPRLTLTQSLEAEASLREYFFKSVQTKMIQPLDEALLKKIDQLTTDSSREATTLSTQESESITTGPKVADFRGKKDLAADSKVGLPTAPASTPANLNQIGDHVSLILDRIALLKFSLKIPGKKALTEFNPQPKYWLWLTANLPSADEKLAERLKDLYIAYLAWQPDDRRLKSELEAQTKLLNKIISNKDLGLAWIMDRVKIRDDLSAITYGPIWWNNDLSGIKGHEIQVEPTYTRKAWEQVIRPAITRLKEQFPDQDAILGRLKEFEDAYWDKYQEQWERFLINLHVGEGILTQLANRLESAPLILGARSPYAKALETAAAELTPLYDSGRPVRPWAANVKTYAQFRSPVFQKAYMDWAKKTKADAATPGFFAQAARTAEELAKATLGQTVVATEEELQLIQLFVDFDERLHQLAATLANEDKTFESVKNAFEVEKATSASVNPVLRAYWDLARLREIMGRNRPEEKPFWDLFERPLIFVWQIQLDVAAGVLQKSWERNVLAEAIDLAGWRKMNTLLYGPEAKVWKFVKGPAAPFLFKDQAGNWTPKPILERIIPFSKAFLELLGAGQRSGRQLSAAPQGAMTIRLEAMPTDVNAEARTGVLRTVIKLYCGKEIQQMENMNFPVAQTFIYKPDECQDLVIEFDTGDAMVEKEYAGFVGFAQFISDIANGQATYKASDLTKTKGDISRYKVETITIRFKKPRGHEPILKFLEYAPENVPDKIIKDTAR
ncbi:MAG: hypothetical protein HQK55_01715 [Deltaproteobacteria bacterium]|nr:hypothetical protein [Deltaproteobacteria bacterium]